ncbi:MULTISPECIES: hypothetical protein [Luteimonas]|uniref:hypothetical protein n=1 Tax=Luteimonas TaxID=83614 RepID=UPI000C7BC4D2|nr:MULTISPECIES: hypothetical protein [Luteimonas]
MSHAPRSAFRPAPLLLALSLAFGAGVASAQDDVSKVNGGITAEAGQAYGARVKDVETVNGGIRAGHDLQSEDIETVNGGINVGDRARVDSLTTVNGGIRVGTGAQIGGNVESVSGGLFVDRDGRVDGNLTTVNGAIGIVATEVTGDIKTVNGDITVGAGSHVRGKLTVEKPSSNWLPVTINRRNPRVIIGPDAVVDGPLEFKREVTLYVHATARTGAITGATAVAYDSARAPEE